jgi:glycosyltransferase involved in cell wall biosynthesis
MHHRILLISSNSSGKGGGERYLVYLTQGLQMLGYEVHVLLSTVNYMDIWAKALAAEGANVHRLNLLPLRNRPLRILQSTFDRTQHRQIADFCREILPGGILVNQQYDEDGLDYLKGALSADIAPVAGVIHMPMTKTKHQRPLGRLRGGFLHQWYKKNPYHLILVSEGSQREFEQYYPYPRPTHLVRHGCPYKSFNTTPSTTPSNLLNHFPIIGFVGQFVPQKNLFLLIHAWEWVRSQGCKTQLMLVGDGPERQNLENYLNEHVPQEEWHITGWTDKADQYLQSIDLYIMTSHFEGLPLALLETVGQGIPTVITNFNGASDVACHAQWVSIATENTPESVGDAIQDAISQIDTLKQLGYEGKQHFQAYFSLERMARETLEVLGLKPVSGQNSGDLNPLIPL